MGSSWIKKTGRKTIVFQVNYHITKAGTIVLVFLMESDRLRTGQQHLEKFNTSSHGYFCLI